MINFIKSFSANNLLSQWPQLAEGQTYAMWPSPLVTSIQLNVTDTLNNPVTFKGWLVWICVKESKSVLKLWIQNHSSTDLQKSMKFLYECLMKFWIMSYVKECFCPYKVCLEIFLYVRNHKKLQYNILKRSFSQVASLLRNSCNIFLNSCLNLGYSQVKHHMKLNKY